MKITEALISWVCRTSRLHIIVFHIFFYGCLRKAEGVWTFYLVEFRKSPVFNKLNKLFATSSCFFIGVPELSVTLSYYSHKYFMAVVTDAANPMV